MSEKFCCRCKEDFDLDPAPGWHMGYLHLLTKAPKWIQQRFHEWLDHPEGKYLCGNCYFDVTDE